MEFLSGPLIAFVGIAALVICTPGPDTAVTVRNALLDQRVHMIDRLYILPDWALLAFWAALLAGLMVVLPLPDASPAVAAPQPREQRLVLRLQATLFTITSFVVAFTLVEAEFNFRKVDGLISAEASTSTASIACWCATVMARARQCGPSSSPTRARWSPTNGPALLASGGGSDKTQQAFMLFSRSILAIEPSLGRQTNIHAEILRSFDAVAEARDGRLNAVTVSLSLTFWQAILFAVLILLFVSSTVERTRFRSIIMAARWPCWVPSSASCSSWTSPLKGHSAVDPQAIVLRPLQSSRHARPVAAGRHQSARMLPARMTSFQRTELAADEIGIAGRAQRARPDADLGKGLLDLGALQGRRDLRLPTLARFPGNVGGGRESEPVGRHNIRETGFARKVGDVGQESDRSASLTASGRMRPELK